ncbi:MAG TPA: hypothetical protein VGO00_07350, partial [Kofleriaceae bacterium]|nr:hypothetical protein [Kofleriaceae bacterium]
MRGLYLLAIAGLTACGGDDQSSTITCSGGASGTLSAGSPITVSGGNDLNGASVSADDHVTLPGSDVSIACADDIVPPGYIALGPAVSFGADGTYSARPFDITLPYKNVRLPDGAARRHVRIVARRWGTNDSFFPMVTNRVLDDADDFASRATFRSGMLTTFQVVASETAGQPETQQYGWNAVMGISMGGLAAQTVGLRHADRFDAFANIGGDPGASMVYFLNMVRDNLFGGFCTTADEAAGAGAVGTLCPRPAAHPDQYEVSSDFEHMLTQTGDGVGLTLDRGLYMKASRDMSRALGNPALYNATNAYAPPGIDFSYFATDPATRCANPQVLANFYNRDFNPDGSKPVITFCDGNDGPRLGNAVFDPTIAPTDPAEVLLAVDLNGNGKRDQGEPV